LDLQVSSDFDIAQQFGPPFLVLVARQLPGGVSPLQQLHRRLHCSVSYTPHWRHERKEDDPKKYPEKPPIELHSPVACPANFVPV
jgi:hypothetical protein